MKKRLIFFLLLLSLFLVSCTKKEDDTSSDKCTLTIDYNLEGVDNDTIEYDYASLVSLPDNHYKNFKGWSWSVSGEEIIEVDFPIYKNETIFALYYESTEKHEFNLNNVDFKNPESNKNLEIVSRVNYTIYKDITYKVVNDIDLKLDIYYPKNDSSLKGVVFSYYGGGWVAGSKESTYYNLLYTDLALSGMVIVCPNYRLCNGSTKFPDPVEDTLDAIRYIVKYQEVLDIDVNKMGSIGYSAGGHLALMAGFAQNYFKSYEPLASYDFKLKFVCDYFGPAVFDSDAASGLSTEGLFFLNSYLGSLDLTNPELEKAMPTYYLDENSPDVIIIHGSKDALVPITQSINLCQMCNDRGMKTKMIIVEGGTHMLSAASGVSSVKPSLLEVFRETTSFIIDAIK